MKLMKKIYQKPAAWELLSQTVPLLAGSYVSVGETESGGGVDPDTEVDTGLSRHYDAWDDGEEDDF